MYLVSNSKTGSARFTEEEKEVINGLLTKIQENQKERFDSFKDAVLKVFGLYAESINTDKQLQTDVNEQPEAINVDAIRAHCFTYSEKHDLPIEFKPLEIVLDALTKDRIETQTVEVLPELKENQVLLEFDEPQLKTVETINKNRSVALVENDYPKEPISTTLKGMLFNSATLGDWSGEFYTGLD